MNTTNRSARPRRLRAALMTVCLTVWACGAEPAPKPKSAPIAPAPTAALPAESWRRSVPEPGEAGKLDYPAADVAVLANGLKVIFIERLGGLVSTSVVALGGAAELPPGKTGLAALTARMMTEGTRDKSSLELAEAVEDLGSSLDQQAGRDHLRIGLTSRSVDFEKALALLAEVIKRPSFDKAELERVRAQWLDDLDAERQHPSRLAALAGLRLALGPRAGAPVSGSPADVKRLSRIELSKYHQSAFVPARMAIIVVGDLPKSSAVSAVEKTFGDLRGTSRPPEVPAPAPAAEPGIYVVDRPEAVQTAIFAAHGLPRRGEPGFEAREVLNNALGGLFTSRLNQNLREKHAYTYGVGSSAIGARHFGLFAIQTSVRTDVTADALRELLVELRALRGNGTPRPLTEEEAARAKADLVQNAGASLEQLERVRADLEQLFVHDLPPDYYATYAARLHALPLEEIRNEARHIAPERLVIVLVGDRAVLEPTLGGLGLPVRPADPSAIE